MAQNPFLRGVIVVFALALDATAALPTAVAWALWHFGDAIRVFYVEQLIRADFWL